ncbi:MarR family winged helix-turn-helix transcriptional regulator [Paraburkholderia sp. DD10]|jgi:DNA-binding MarR family transcriptional regulator|uniref:DNA-binding MarR family transcriptional regulator n=1 Tax=Paraburkholderia terricola TaxID=169427 RepID=A0A1M6TCY1_9BURK|nr:MULTISPECIES: MarR family transcriptional regulator [Paraburkholderia]ORC51881.1 transcriptional regulator [Burkholderia sp. A27]AXE95623.1 MarR family transcriptional regulator [Paraburkholderia terricola]MDR6412754.1 DNA-binding MarR family transcriptional regulator [Paraburkholderia terricola]MDR6485249.1 DNA-binding MarR family transcriptional regulator [Paraburkholderia terricola]MDR6496601.1 DNA-binding MarR family transcriptional regulator [Paraburkholderia terricola]
MLPENQPIGIDQCNCFTVRKAARQISRLYDAFLQPSGLRITQFLILATLNEQQSASVNALAERLDIERTAMGKMIGFLERDGFVTMRPSPTDGRIRIVELTPEGTELFERAAPLWLEAQHQFSIMNGPKNVASLRRNLSRMKVDNGAASSVE